MVCPKCLYQPAPDEYIPAETTRKYAAGDICRVAESIKVPFLQIFEETRRRLTWKKTGPSSASVGCTGATSVPKSEAGRGAGSVTTTSPTHSRRASAASQALQSINSYPSAAYHRPGILVSGHYHKRRFAEVFLLASFRDLPMEKMPTVVQCFSVAIFPNLGSDDANPNDHIHVLPEWPQNKTAWLVARKVTTTRTIDGRWSHSDDTESPQGRTCSRLDRIQRAKLSVIAEDRLDRWISICGSLEILNVYEREFLVSFFCEALSGRRCSPICFNYAREPNGDLMKARAM